MKANRTVNLCSMLVIATAIALAPTLAATVASAQGPAIEPIPWDSAKMTALTKALQKDLSDLRQSFRKDPAVTEPASLNQRSAQEMLDHLKALELSARQLHARVAKGENMEQTAPIARKMGTLLRDAEVLGRRFQVGAWVIERVVAAQGVLNQIAPYYGVSKLYDDDGKLIPRKM